MDLKQAALTHIYSVLEETLRDKSLVCQPGCATCCTLNVTLTTIEGDHIISYLKQIGQIEWLDRLTASTATSSFRLVQTLNELAKTSESRDDDRDASSDPHMTGTCPLLMNNECLIYPVRPLACRTMVSRHPCHEYGYAVMDDFILAVSTVLLQFTEHIDQNGSTGYLTPVLTYLANAKNRKAYRSGKQLADSSDLVPNQPLTVLMVPPDQHRAITPVLKALNLGLGELFGNYA